jgi:hypothetical protein
VLDQALAAVTAATADFARASVLADLAPLLPPALLASALAVAKAIATDDDRARALTKLATYLPPDQRLAVLEQALSAATAIANDEKRAEALTELALGLPRDRRQVVFAAALAAATATTESPPSGRISSNAQAGALTALAPHLQPDQLEQALAAASVIDREADCALAIAGLTPHLPPELLEHGFVIAVAINDDEDREYALADMAADLPLQLLADAIDACPKNSTFAVTAILNRAFALTSPNARMDWVNLQRSAFRKSDRNACLNVIVSTASAIAEIGGETVVRACVNAIIDADDWWP